MNNSQSDTVNEIQKLSARVMQLCTDRVLVHLRFLDVAIGKIQRRPRFGIGGIALEGNVLWYDPETVLRSFKQGQEKLCRSILHSILHVIFLHTYSVQKLEKSYWDIACDIAVESVVRELDLPGFALDSDGELLQRLKALEKLLGVISAEKVYRYFKADQTTESTCREYRRIFALDLHDFWHKEKPEELEITQEQWQQISRKIRADLQSFSKAKGQGESMRENLREAIRKRQDYSSILRSFTIMGEQIATSEDEFDYVYYTYGLKMYGNMPLIEPLEYREEKKVREFAICIDTSASCKGEIVRNFLRKTYQILMSGESFFHKVNVHLILCDSEVQEDIVITDAASFEKVLQELEIKGFGATDFRPAFAYVDKLIADKHFENLKGLIYFTDGYGIYPERMPGYEVIFAFLRDDPNRMQVPSWAMQVILNEEEF